MSEAAARLVDGFGAGPAQSELPDHHIEAQTSLVERALRSLKGDEAFAVVDAYGDMGLVAGGPEGLFYKDTRHLSFLHLSIDGRRPLLLSSALQSDNSALSIDLTNPELHDPVQGVLPQDTIAIQRTKFLREGICHERIGLQNFGPAPRTFRLEIRFAADFHDLFEARGMHRERRGAMSAEVRGPGQTVFTYAGLDGIGRRTHLVFDPQPRRLTTERAVFEITLAPRERRSVFLAVGCTDDDMPCAPEAFFLALRRVRRSLRELARGSATVTSSNDLFDSVAGRAHTDLLMLLTPTPHGYYPYAGIPWYSTTFGRDGIITALLMLWMQPEIARGVLNVLAATQATEIDPAADAQPGKILHETRDGEMARLGEVPFRFYYGTVDATPLFLMLAGAYFERTGDRETIRAIWPAIEAALAWIDTWGDVDGDGFVEYRRETDKGLINQGWKDSHDSVFHADGSDAHGPIALCEVQAYVYAGKRAVAGLARAFGRPELGLALDAQAEALRVRFEEAFWDDDLGTYALALDGAKRPCLVRASNAGHALFCGIASPERAARVAATLTSEAGFSGWGIRTIARGEARYNPMSYHNGSIWPHDNALIAAGFARYGLKAQAARTCQAIFDAAIQHEQHRLPELFCGFTRRRRRGPTSYPVACSPQAWAAASPFGLLGACLGLHLDHAADVVRFDDPVMPPSLDEVVLRNLSLGGSRLDIRLQRYGEDVVTNVVRRHGTAKVVVSK